jgi:hypothetical protein
MSVRMTEGALLLEWLLKAVNGIRLWVGGTVGCGRRARFNLG